MAVISLKNVSYRYPLESQKVIEDVSYDFEQGKVYGLIGENGSGKTTLCNIIRGFIPQLYRGDIQGQVLVKGKSVREFAPGELAAVLGYTFQNPFVQMSGVKDTVYEEIAYGMENIGMPQAKMIDKAEYLVNIFHLESLVQKNPYELSGGQKQRVALASVIALDPEIIILDEPTSQLDPQSTEDIFEIIKTLKTQGKTIILIEHKIDLAAQYCDSILLMQKGRLAMYGDAKDVLREPKVLEAGGQLPQVVLYFLKRFPDTSGEMAMPLTVEQGYEILKKGGGL